MLHKHEKQIAKSKFMIWFIPTIIEYLNITKILVIITKTMEYLQLIFTVNAIYLRWHNTSRTQNSRICAMSVFESQTSIAQIATLILIL